MYAELSTDSVLVVPQLHSIAKLMLYIPIYNVGISRFMPDNSYRRVWLNAAQQLRM